MRISKTGLVCFFISQAGGNFIYGMDQDTLPGPRISFKAAIKMETNEVLRINAISEKVYDVALELDRAETTVSSDEERHQPLPNNLTIGNREYKIYPFYSETGALGHYSKTCMGGIFRPYKNGHGLNKLHIVVRGTMMKEGATYLSDVCTDLDCLKVAAPTPLSGNIHEGFSHTATLLYTSFKKALSTLIEQESGIGQESIIKDTFELNFSGHSLGAALTTILAARFTAEKNISRKNQVKVLLVSGPLIGDREFVESVYSYIPKQNILHFACKYDLITCVPPRYFNFREIGVVIETLALERIKERGIGSFLTETPIISTITEFPQTMAGLAGMTLPFAIKAHSFPPHQTTKKAFNDFKSRLAREGMDRAGQVSPLDKQRNPVLKLFK